MVWHLNKKSSWINGNEYGTICVPDVFNVTVGMLWNSYVCVKCWELQISMITGKKIQQICFCHVKRMNVLSRMDAQQWKQRYENKNGMKMWAKGGSNRRNWREHFRLNTRKNYVCILTLPEYLRLIWCRDTLFQGFMNSKTESEFRSQNLMHVFRSSPDRHLA